ncbi:MAG: hypothetical protein V4736_10445, partial [Bdellovibrionota bacterium]
ECSGSKCEGFINIYPAGTKKPKILVEEFTAIKNDQKHLTGLAEWKQPSHGGNFPIFIEKFPVEIKFGNTSAAFTYTENGISKTITLPCRVMED